METYARTSDDLFNSRNKYLSNLTDSRLDVQLASLSDKEKNDYQFIVPDSSSLQGDFYLLWQEIDDETTCAERKKIVVNEAYHTGQKIVIKRKIIGIKEETRTSPLVKKKEVISSLRRRISIPENDDTDKKVQIAINKLLDLILNNGKLLPLFNKWKERELSAYKILNEDDWTEEEWKEIFTKKLKDLVSYIRDQVGGSTNLKINSIQRDVHLVKEDIHTWLCLQLDIRRKNKPVFRETKRRGRPPLQKQGKERRKDRYPFTNRNISGY